jgi:hypothetical protein
MIAQAIKDQAAKYISGEMSLRDFEDWFLPATWDLPETERESRDLANVLRLRLAEHDNGDWTESELRSLIAQAIEARSSART